MDQLCSENKRKAYLQETSRSPWSSESTNSSSSPLPSACTLNRANSGGSGSHGACNTCRFPQERSFWSGGSTCSLGSSPGASFNTSLTVPDYNACCPMVVPNSGSRTCQGGTGSSKPERSPSPFNIKARVRRRRQKRMERQSNLNATSCDDHAKNESNANLNVNIYGGRNIERSNKKLTLSFLL